MTTEAVTLTDDEIRRIEFDGLADTDVHTAPNALIAVFESVLAARLAGAGAQVTEAARQAAGEAIDRVRRNRTQTSLELADAALTAAAPHMGTGQSEADLRARISALADKWENYDSEGYAAGDGPDPWVRTDALRALLDRPAAEGDNRLAEAWDEGRASKSRWAICPDCLGHGCESCQVVNPYRSPAAAEGDET